MCDVLRYTNYGCLTTQLGKMLKIQYFKFSLANEIVVAKSNNLEVPGFDEDKLIQTLSVLVRLVVLNIYIYCGIQYQSSTVVGEISLV